MDVERELSGMMVNHEKVTRLFKNLVLAYQKRSRRRKTVDAVHEQIAKVRQAAVKRAPKRVVEEEVGNLQQMISSILDDEKALLSQQREETRMLLELRARLDDMEKRILQQPQVPNAVGAMKELHTINEALHDISNKLDAERARRGQARREETAEKAVLSGIEAKEDIADRKIMEIEAQLKLIERRHRQLAESGYSKKQLIRVKALIEKHKAKLERLKKKKRR